jgi:hypothetical protein
VTADGDGERDAAADPPAGPLVSALGWGRVAMGAAMTATPGLVARAWLSSDEPTVRLLLRGLGVRDLALGVGLLVARDRSTWLWAGVASDAVDAWASALAAASLPRRRFLPVTVLALGAAVAGAGVARSAGRATR